MCITLELCLNIPMTPEQRHACTRTPLLARLDVGIEPVDIDEMQRLCTELEDWDYEDIQGMLQVHYISSPFRYMTSLGPLQYDSLPPKQWDAWIAQREELDQTGHEDCPLVRLEVISNVKECIDVFIPISPETFLYANLLPPFTRKLPRNLLDPFTGRRTHNLCAEYIKCVLSVLECGH